MPLADLAECWLHLSGCCRCYSSYPLRLMAQRVGGHHRLGDVLPRLRCASCGGKPASTVLMNRGDDNPYGARAGWRIDLSSGHSVDERWR